MNDSHKTKRDNIDILYVDYITKWTNTIYTYKPYSKVQSHTTTHADKESVSEWFDRKFGKIWW